MKELLGLLTDTPQEGGSMLVIILVYGGFFAFMYFVLFRPQRKKQKAVQTMQSSIKVGDSIVTNGGFYGVVVDVVNDVVMVEFGTNKSVRVPVQKAAISSIAEPNLTIVHEDEEESK